MKKIIILLLCFCTQLVVAGSLKTDNPIRKPAGQVGVMSELQSKKITRYSEFLADEKYSEAKNGLSDMLKGKGVSGYVEAVIYQLLGHIDTLQGNYASAARNFNQSIEIDAMPNTTQFSMMRQYAQLLMMNDDHQGGIKALDRYFAVTDEIPDSAFAIKANAHAKLEQFRAGKTAIIQAIQLADKPKENWYQLLLAFHSELTEYREMAEVLQTLVSIVPNKKTYWMQLSSVYFTLKEDKKSLSVLELANKKGLLEKESDYLQLFKMYSYNNVPYKAAETLQMALDGKKVEANFKHWKQAGAVWYEARELDKALVAYDNASQFATDGDMDLTRSYLYIGMEDYSKAVESITAALQKGGLDTIKIGDAWMMLGMSHASLNNYARARTAFNNAVKYEKSKNNAQQWLQHLKTLEEKAARNAS